MERGRKLKRFDYWLTLYWSSKARMGPSWCLASRVSPGSPIWISGDQALERIPPLYTSHSEGVRSQVEQPGYELAPHGTMVCRQLLHLLCHSATPPPPRVKVFKVSQLSQRLMYKTEWKPKVTLAMERWLLTDTWHRVSIQEIFHYFIQGFSDEQLLNATSS